MKMNIARPSKYIPFYRLEKPSEIEINGEIYKSPDRKEIELPDEEVDSICRTTTDFLHLQSWLGFNFHGVLDFEEHQKWKEV